MEDIFRPQVKATLTASKKPAKKSSSEIEGQLTIDVYQTDDEIIIKSAIAGVSVDDMDISVTQDMVTIKGERTRDQKIKDSNYYYQELYWGRFSRSIILPEDIDPDKAKASMKNGILIIRLPKLRKSRTKKLTVE